SGWRAASTPPRPSGPSTGGCSRRPGPGPACSNRGRWCCSSRASPLRSSSRSPSRPGPRGPRRPSRTTPSRDWHERAGMRILHTADWHVGKRLGRIDRMAEYEQALDEVVEIARDRKADLAIVAGDLLDRAMPPLECIQLVIDALLRLADAAGRVVAMPGNHDSPALFSLLAPLLAPRGVLLAPYIRRPEAGCVLRVRSKRGCAVDSVAVV